jgi:hypothetical protein
MTLFYHFISVKPPREFNMLIFIIIIIGIMTFLV